MEGGPGQNYRGGYTRAPSVGINPLDHIVRRRVGDKGPDAFLFHELPTPAQDSPIERSQRISKAFTAFRRKLGVDDVPEGHRQSRIDFHSFRRWFVNRAAQALNYGATGFTQWTIAQVVGHEREQQPLGMTMGRYHGEDDFEALRACVASVSLPTEAVPSTIIVELSVVRQFETITAFSNGGSGSSWL